MFVSASGAKMSVSQWYVWQPPNPFNAPTLGNVLWIGKGYTFYPAPNNDPRGGFYPWSYQAKQPATGYVLPFEKMPDAPRIKQCKGLYVFRFGKPLEESNR